MARVYLDVPFDEKEQAKALGARWVSSRKAWYVPGGEDAMKFARWHEELANWEGVVDSKGELTQKGKTLSKLKPPSGE